MKEIYNEGLGTPEPTIQTSVMKHAIKRLARCHNSKIIPNSSLNNIHPAALAYMGSYGTGLQVQ
jgi:hypothetical protein